MHFLLFLKKNKDEKETYSSGSASVFVEESIVPIFGAVTEMFQFTYENAKITTVSKSENEFDEDIAAQALATSKA